MRLNEHTELPTRKLNRLARRTPRTGLFWCDYCDQNHVGAGQKCALCGHRDTRPRIMRKGELK